jgi:glycosyltransferase involved in cell wall biosynthesis
MKISIITVCRNSAKTIETTIKSVIAQTHQDIEYIIVDGDSTDGTKELISKYGDRIKFISEPDRCLWEAMNKGIRLATGDFLYFINSDDYLIDEKVFQDVVSFIKERPSTDFVYGDIEIRKIDGKSEIQKSPRPEEIIETMVVGCSVPHAGSFIKSELFEKFGLYNEAYKIGSDYEWVTKLMQDQTLKIFYYPRVIGSFYAGGISSNLKENLTEMFDIQNNVLVYQSEYWLRKRIIIMQKYFVYHYDFLQKVEKLSDDRLNLINILEKTVNDLQSGLFWQIRTGIKKVYLLINSIFKKF